MFSAVVFLHCHDLRQNQVAAVVMIDVSFDILFGGCCGRSL